MKFFRLFAFVFLVFMFLDFVSAAHYITGYVNDALDGEGADGHMVVLYNSANGAADNLTDIIGVSGNSGASNTYLIDCELLVAGCFIGDNLTLRIVDSGDGYIGRGEINVTVTGAGYDVAENLTINSLPVFSGVEVDDSFNLVLNEIDLLANSTREVVCSGVVSDYENDTISIGSAVFYNVAGSGFSDVDDNNYHYSNSSCFVNSSYGNNQSYFECGFNVFYYADYGSWRCEVFASDGFGNGSGADLVNVNTLLSVGVEDSIGFNLSVADSVSNETELVIYNMGNVEIDLGIYGYGASVGDGYSMSCGGGGGIDVFYQKYNLTSSISGDLTLLEFDATYKNLSSSRVVEDFNLTSRTNDFVNDAFKSSYWRIYVPSGVGTICSGNIVLEAIFEI